MHIKITVKKFQDVSNFAVSAADLHGILAPDEFKLEKLYSPTFWKLQFQNLLIHENTSNFSASARPIKPPKHNS